MNARRRFLLRGLPAVAAAMVVAAAVVALPSAGASGFGGSFKALAAADGARATLVMPGVTVVKSLVDVGSTSAQATLNNLSESRAFASIPYPGELAIVGPGTVAGATNGQVNLPGYPLYAWSDYPARESQVVGDGPMAMRAESSATKSEGTASSGLSSDGVGDAGLSRSNASITSTEDGVVAKATSETTSFAVGPLEIGRVTSLAEATFDQAGQLARKADARIAGVIVAGSPVQISQAGLSAAGAPSPPPDLKPLNEALKPAGLSIELVPARETRTGVVAPAFRVTQATDSGSSLTYQLGSATASVEGAVDPAGADGDAGADDVDVTGPDETAAPGSASAPGPSDPSGGSAAFADPPPSGSAGSDTFYAAPSTVAVPSAPGAAASGRASAVAAPSDASYPSAGAAADTGTPPVLRTDNLEPGAAAAPAGEGTTDVDGSVPVLASRLLDGGDARPFYAAFVAAAIVGLAGVVGLALLSRALTGGPGKGA